VSSGKNDHRHHVGCCWFCWFCCCCTEID
jgi:hypothetical protein